MQVPKKNGNSIIFVLAFCLIVSGCATEPADRAGQSRMDTEDFSGMKLWYKAPAQEWAQALPVGNGRLGAMIFGGTENERLQFNEDTLWTGRPHEYQHNGAVAYLPIVRKLLFEGKQREAEKLAGEKMMSVPLRQEKYQPFGDLRLSFPGHDKAFNYRRELDIDSSLATVRYSVGDIKFTREVFCSYPDRVIAVRLTCDKPGQLTFSAKLDSPHPDTQTLIADDTLALRGRLQDYTSGRNKEIKPSVLKFEARLGWRISGGEVMAADDALVVAGADSVTLFLAAATSYKNFKDVTGNPAEICRRTI
ncbi:MAG: glycoside hydrolase family 95 protein, partial [Planctomycetota bacterium]